MGGAAVVIYGEGVVWVALCHGDWWGAFCGWRCAVVICGESVYG